MPIGLTDVQVVNSALEQIASQERIASLAEDSPGALAAAVVYAPTVQLLLRELDPDFARFTAALSIAPGVTPVTPWTYEYLYPDTCIRLRQVRPPAGGYNILDPQPIRSNVAVDVVSGQPTKVILTNQITALAVYTTSRVTEAQWDAVFTDAVVRRLANPLAMALSGRPDFAREILEQSARMASAAGMADENMVMRAP